MVINRRAQTVSVLSFTSGTDAYGEKRTLGNTTRQVEMALSLYQHNQTDDIRFQDINLIGLTNALLSIGEQVIVNNEKFDVKFINDTGRINVIYLQKVK